MHGTVHQGGHGGFTLVELLVAMALMVILLSLGIPAFAEMLANWQRDQVTKAITAHLQLARTEAIKSTRRVVLCNTIDGSTCSTDTDKEWKTGWIIFQDLNEDNQRDSNESILATRSALQGIQSLSSNIKTKRFVFLPSGLMASGMRTLSVIPRMGRTQKITINRIGRARLSMSDTPS